MDSMVGLLHTMAGAMTTGQLPQLGFGTYVLLAVLVAIEGPIATLLGAAAASAGLLRPELVFATAATSNLAADSLWYSLGYLGKAEWIFRISRWLGLREGLIQRIKQKLLLHSVRMLFLAKVTVTFVVPSLITAGLLRIPWRRWFPAVVAGETIWTGLLVLMGFYSTEALKRVHQGVEYALLGASALFVILMIFAVRRMIIHEDPAKPSAPES